MRRALAAAALLAFLPAAHAQDKAKGEMTHNGEFRVRDNWMMNQTADKNTKPTNKNTLTERFKLDLGFKATDKLSVNTTLINAFTWGADNSATHDGSHGAADYLAVNQAYAKWGVADDLNLMFGRMNIQIGDGSLIAINDFEATPYSFEGVLGAYEAEFGRFHVFGLKVADNQAGTYMTSDPERNVYGVNFDLKTMPEMLKMVNVHLLKDASDAAMGGTAGRDIMRYGLGVNMNFAIVDVKANYEAESGKLHTYTGGGAKTDTTVSSSMMQAEVGATFANAMNTRVHLRYHQDTGNKDSSDATPKQTVYDAYFHEQHCSAGCMDLFDWGNLTFIEVGATMKPMDNTDVGISYWMFSKTEKEATGSTATRKASAAKNGTGGASLGTGVNADKAKLGDEFDIWAQHHYNSNLSTTLRLSQFMPGEVYKANSGAKKDTISEIFLEAKMTF